MKNSRFGQTETNQSNIERPIFNRSFLAIMGGLGNQMFGYAHYIYLKNHLQQQREVTLINYCYGHNGYELDRIFGISHGDMIDDLDGTKYIDNCAYKKVFEPVVCKFFVDSVEHSSESILMGYWQSHKYVEANSNTIRELFQFREEHFNAPSRKFLEHIESVNSVSLHIRRGDYTASMTSKIIYCNITTVDYYRKAIARIKDMSPDAYFFIFTDDKQWVEANFALENSTVVDCNTGDDSWQDMMLMSHCRHNIIANSSFSWWGAWLNSNPDKVVIAPSVWINGVQSKGGIVPENWTVINVKPNHFLINFASRFYVNQINNTTYLKRKIKRRFFKIFSRRLQMLADKMS